MNTCKGDLKTYHIHMEPADGLGADLALESMATPYRPGTGYITFGSDEEFYTWLCVVPKGKVSGTLTYGGKTHQVTGFGYPDHQWFGVNFQKKFNHWVWARQSFDDYTMLTFDMVTNKESGYVRFPIVFIEDKDGNIVFENTQNVTCNVLDEYHDGVSDEVIERSGELIYEFMYPGETYKGHM